MRTLYLALYLTVISSLKAQIPRPDHIVMIIFENRSYSYLMANPAKAPYIHSLLGDPNVAHFTQSYALTNPSQPNYLILYSGSNQGLTTDTIPDDLPYHTCNLGSELLAKGFSISSYCESMPSVGYLGNYSGNYVKRHNPVAYWQGSGTNNTPPSSSQPFSNFPSDFTKLPDVSIVIPNLANNMHSGGTKTGDDWLQANLKNYIDWTKANNSLLILTFDEDDYSSNGHILTFFYGQMIKGGLYNSRIDHNNVLRTIEDIYGLGACGDAASSSPIDYVWKNGPTGSHEKHTSAGEPEVYPVPSNGELTIRFNTNTPDDEAVVCLLDSFGKVVMKKSVTVKNGENHLTLAAEGLSSGMYQLLITGKNNYLSKKITIL